MNGRKVALVIIVPALVSSTKPITDASAVPLLTRTRKAAARGRLRVPAVGTSGRLRYTFWFEEPALAWSPD